MSLQTVNHVLAKKYVSKYKDFEIEIGKMLHIKNNTELDVAGALAMIQEGQDKHLHKIINSPSLYKIQKNCTLRNSSSLKEITVNLIRKYHPNEAAKT